MFSMVKVMVISFLVATSSSYAVSTCLAPSCGMGCLTLTPVWNYIGRTGQPGGNNGYLASNAPAVGDFNGDGLLDLAVAEERATNASGPPPYQQVYVFYNTGSGYGTLPDLTYDLIPGYPVGTGHLFTIDLAAGDIDSDGIDELVIGNHSYDAGSNFEGRVSVYHGSTSGLTTTPWWQKVGPNADSFFGGSVAILKNAWGDGFGCLVIGTTFYLDSGQYHGLAEIYHPTAGVLPASASWSTVGQGTYSNYGAFTENVGDVNGDAYDDLIVTEPGYLISGHAHARAYLFLGQSGGPSTTPSQTFDLGEIGGPDRHAISVTSADFNGDSFNDVAFGLSTMESNAGNVQIYYGDNTGTLVGPSCISTGYRSGNYVGHAVSGVQDMNGDGFDELAIDRSAGETALDPKDYVFIFEGSDVGIQNCYSLSFDTSYYEPPSQTYHGLYGYSLTNGRDINGDGLGDLVIGNHRYGTPGGITDFHRGRVDVFAGSGPGCPPYPTRTPSPTRTQTKTVTPTRTITVTRTIEGAFTFTRTFSPTITPTWSRTGTRTATPTHTERRTKTTTVSSTATVTPSITRTPTPTRTSSPTPSNSATLTITVTFSNTKSDTPTYSMTPSHSVTRTATPTRTITATSTDSRTDTPTRTITSTRTITDTNTITRTPTPTRTHTGTRTNTPTPTNTPTSTNTPPHTLTPTPTITQTSTHTPSPTDTGTYTITPTYTETPSITQTGTWTPSSTRTPCVNPSVVVTVQGYHNCVDQSVGYYGDTEYRRTITASAVIVGPLAVGDYEMRILSGCIYYGGAATGPLYGTRLRWTLDDNNTANNVPTNPGAWSTIGNSSYYQYDSPWVPGDCESVSAIGLNAPYNPALFTVSAPGTYLYLLADDNEAWVCGDNANSEDLSITQLVCEEEGGGAFRTLQAPAQLRGKAPVPIVPVRGKPEGTPGKTPVAFKNLNAARAQDSIKTLDPRIYGALQYGGVVAVPNPVTGPLDALFLSDGDSSYSLFLQNLEGMDVLSRELGLLPQGLQRVRLATQGLAPGIYFLVLRETKLGKPPRLTSFKVAILN
jgi:hypothetical protein